VPFEDCYITPEAHRAAARVLTSGRLETGPERAAFERDVAHLAGARHAVAVASCTAGIELALRSLRLDPDALVLVPALTFCGAVQAVVHAGLQPVLVDVDPETGMPTAQTVDAAVNATGAVAAMVVVHWAGAPADVTALADAARLDRSRVVEDAGHALGARRQGMPVGSGAAVCFSFSSAANLAIGQGGMVLTDDAERAEWLRRARGHGTSTSAARGSRPLRTGGRYDDDEPGLNAEMDELHAAIGRGQLTHFPRWQHRRRQIAARYDAAFAATAGVQLPHRPATSGGRHAWRLYGLRLLPSSGVGRGQLVATMAAAGIEGAGDLLPMHRLPAFRDLCAVPPPGLPGADAYLEQVVYLPIHPRLTDQQVDHVSAAVRAVMALFGGARPVPLGR
jgi:dTDP-4-amino-4,6-dideoxygalactose transaminase